jgi:hypothetical protein
MNSIGRIFLEQGGPKDHNGSRVHLGLTFTSEEDLDHDLLCDPAIAEKNLHYLLKVHKDEMTPSLARIALKAIAWPLFMREFYGEDAPDELAKMVQNIPEHTGRLLDAYMDRVADPGIDQSMLSQAIDLTTAMHIVSRSLRTPDTNDIVMLPAISEDGHKGRSASFTVLRPQSLGRALLFVSNNRPRAYIHTPQAKDHHIRIHPQDLLSESATRYDLAEALIAEQRHDLEPEDTGLIAQADAHIHNKITAHFETIDPRS